MCLLIKLMTKLSFTYLCYRVRNSEVGEHGSHPDHGFDHSLLDEPDSDQGSEVDSQVNLLELEAEMSLGCTSDEYEKEEGECTDSDREPTGLMPVNMEVDKDISNVAATPAPVEHLPDQDVGLPNIICSLDSAPISWERSKATINRFRADCAQASFKMPKMACPPPSPPAWYGTTLFPTLQPLLNQCPSSILATINKNYLAEESSAFEKTRVKDCFAHLHKTVRNNKPFCATCSEYQDRPTPIWHRHYSSKRIRLKSPQDEFFRYSCSQCKHSPHYFLTGGRSPILLTSSALHNYWGHGENLSYADDKLHCDVVSIPGAKLRDLSRAFKSEYDQHFLPTDTLVVGGINNILSCPVFEPYLDNLETVEDLLPTIKSEVVSASRRLRDEARELAYTVLSRSPKNQSNSIAYATLPTPPCLAWSAPTINLATRGANIIKALKLEMLTKFNSDLQEINNEIKLSTGINTTRAPSFRSWGLKRVDKSTTFGPPTVQEAALGPFSHRLEQFRERNPEHKLHLTTSRKFKMAQACHRYFLALYELV